MYQLFMHSFTMHPRSVYNYLDKTGCERLSEDYTDTGDARLVVSVEAGPIGQGLAAAVSNATNGKVLPMLIMGPDAHAE